MGQFVEREHTHPDDLINIILYVITMYTASWLLILISFGHFGVMFWYHCHIGIKQRN
jgi:hypothetical protein